MCTQFTSLAESNDFRCLLPYEAETNPVLDPLEAITGFELMIGLMGYTVLWCGRFIAHKVTTWRKNRPRW
jgi:hypothetical protein